MPNTQTKPQEPAGELPGQVLSSDTSHLSYIDKLDGKKKAFLSIFRQTNGHITDSCRSLPIARQTFYNWLEDDEVFAQAVRDIEWELNDEMRQALIHKAQVGDTASLIFWLKKRHPEFKETPQTLIQNNTVIANKRREYELD